MTASGAKSAISTRHHTIASQTSSPAGAPSQRWRSASTTVLTGFAFATASSGPGIDAVGTNADEMNVIGKISVKPSPFAASGDDTDIPISAKIHENAYPNSSSSANPATMFGTVASKLNPMITPVT